MEISFKGRPSSYNFRFLRSLLIIPLGFAISYLYLFQGKFADQLSFNLKIIILVIFLITACYGIYYQSQITRTVINEVKFTNDTIELIGLDYNKFFKDIFPISDVVLEIQKEDLGKNHHRYCIEFYYDNKYYYINKFNDWSYKNLKAIVDQYKKETQKEVMGMRFYTNLTNED
ncbi:hypothetical protein [Flavobacterium silvaticum]|uniref:Uncharacterized protein n=1 Tax=Flavobacterium silvaticum TaxID=1852020 RepID=A0A972FR63_9FLAO|nr:hypothetical protein [Flavobacterium silvaticum]NMH26482.1 hypothetical protein [Flavobacterium silvaticum]